MQEQTKGSPPPWSISEAGITLAEAGSQLILGSKTWHV